MLRCEGGASKVACPCAMSSYGQPVAIKVAVRDPEVVRLAIVDRAVMSEETRVANSTVGHATNAMKSCGMESQSRAFLRRGAWRVGNAELLLNVGQVLRPSQQLFTEDCRPSGRTSTEHGKWGPLGVVQAKEVRGPMA